MHHAYSPIRLRTVGTAAALLFGATLAVAQTVWSGAASTDWFEAANWSNGLPDTDNAAIVPGGSTVNLTGPLTADFDVDNFGTLIISEAFEMQASLSNSGTLRTSAPVVIAGTLENFADFEVAPAGSLLLAAGSESRSNGTLFAEGEVRLLGALVNEGALDIAPQGSLDATGAASLVNAGEINVSGTFSNRNGAAYQAPSGGTVNVEAGGVLKNANGATFTNAGVVNVETDGRFEQAAALVNEPGRIFVAGTLETLDGATTRSNFLTVEAGGSLEVSRGDAFTVAFSLVNAGSVSIERPVTVTGLLTNEASGTLTTSGPGLLDFTEGTDFTNAGTVNNGGTVRTVGLLTNAGTFTNTGTFDQRNGGAIDNDGTFVNQALIANIDRIANDGSFENRGTLTNGSGGIIENNGDFINVTDATIENLFEVYNNASFVNHGFLKNGVSIFNDALFDNYGFLANVGDVFNNAAGTFNNYSTGVVDNSAAGIFTNDGLFENDGEVNNFDCGILVNNGRFDNRSWIQNEGIFFQNGALNGKPTMGDGPVVADGGSSPAICQPYTQSLDAFGSTVVGAARFAAARYDSCEALQYLVDGEEEITLGCEDVGTREVTFTLVDRRGNRINCATTLTIVDDEAPRLTNECPTDIPVEVTSAPSSVSWTPPTFTDNCDGELAVVSDFEPGDLFDDGSTVVTYTATDDYGNSTTCAFTVTVSVAPGCTPKNADGLIAYYNLRGGEGKRVLDRSGYGEPLPLEIRDRHSISWLPDCGLENSGESIVRSYGGAGKVGRAIMMSRAMTVEAWVRPGKFQTGPERIVTYSENTHKRNFTLAQEGDRFVFRLKTSETNDNGMPNRTSRAGAVRIGELQHVVFTRSASGDERLYVDGELSYEGHVAGDFDGWGTHCRLSLFNEQTLDRSFKGAIRNVAIYDRALSDGEVAASLAAGACCDEGDDSPLGQICEGPRGQVSYERYEGIGGIDLPWLYKAAKYPASPDVSQKLTALDIPRDQGDLYGSRTRGFIYPAASGHYRFALSGDDHTRFLLSAVGGDPAHLRSVAAVRGWTHPGQLHKYEAQKSSRVYLQAGQGYYFEVLHKEKHGRDHASVYWKTPGAHTFTLIGAESIGDIEDCSQAPAEDCNRSVLFVVGNANLNAGDAAVEQRLLNLGYEVMTKDALWATTELAADKGLVLISSTVKSSHVDTRFRHLPVPVMTYETHLYDDLGMTGEVSGTDFGKVHTGKLTVIGGNHPLAAGRAGRQRVTHTNGEVAFGKIMGSDAKVIAHAPSDIWLASIFVYDTGDHMAGGMEAPATRIGFYLTQQTAADWTDYGRALFDEAVRYATTCPPLAEDPDLLTLRAAQDVSAVRLDWTANAGFKTESFVIERSSDDVTFEVIDEVAAPTVGSDIEAFTYVDDAPLSGQSFYRVKAVYTDGVDRTSELRKVDFTDLGQVGMFPNPAYDQVTISLAGFDGRELELTVIDARGRHVLNRSLSGDQLTTELTVDHLPAGTYGVTLRSGGYHVTKVLTLTRD